MKRGDIWLIAIVLIAVSLSTFYWLKKESAADAYEGKLYAQIIVDGEVQQTVELTEELQKIPLKTKFGYNLLEIEKGSIHISEADCRDEVCIAMGAKHRVGDTIVCLPNHVLIEVIGEPGGGGGQIDAVST